MARYADGSGRGGVLVLAFDKDVRLPNFMRLGGSQLEGYGRVLVNPAFLENPLPEIPDMPPVEKTPDSVQPELNNLIWHILRERAIERFVAKQAREWLHEWADFIKQAAALKRPTASQRANVMNMTPEKFKEMLAKTPGEQWRQAVCPDPFASDRESRNVIRDSLDVIMEKLLNPDIFLEKFPPTIELKLPGGMVSEQDKKDYGLAAYKLFKRDLVRAWSKQARIGNLQANRREQ